MPISPVWWLDDRSAPKMSPELDRKKLDQVIDLVQEYTKNDLEALKELREAIMQIPGIPPETSLDDLMQRIEDLQNPPEED